MRFIQTLTYWIFSKTNIGKKLEGYKTEIGFVIWVLSWLVVLLAKAALVFPQVQALPGLVETLIAVENAARDYAANLGLGVMAVGVGHAAVAENVEAKKLDIPVAETTLK